MLSAEKQKHIQLYMQRSRSIYSYICREAEAYTAVYAEKQRPHARIY
jgi:hypothetical protein